MADADGRPNEMSAATSRAREDLASHVEIVCARAALLIAERDRLDELVPALRDRRTMAEAQRPSPASKSPMDRLQERLELAALHVDFLWTAVAAAVEPRVAVHVEALAGNAVRRGASVALHARIGELAPAAARDLAIWLARPNPLVDAGILVGDDASTAVSRCYHVPARVLAYLGGDDTPDPGLRTIAPPDPTHVIFDPDQVAILGELRRMLAARPVIVLEGPTGSGRTTAIAHAADRALIALDVSRLAGDALRAGLVALRREVVLGGALPVVAHADRLGDTDRALLVAFVHASRGALVVTSAAPDLDVGSERPIVRIRWTAPTTETRTELWHQLAGGDITGDIDALATRFRVGPGTIARAVQSARIASTALDAGALTAGLRHNISEDLGGLAQRVDVTQSWADLVLAPDTLDQVHTLISRVRHAHQVLERWSYRGKMARGTGVPALFSGPPGTGKTMVAGLIARELGLDLYQVDLSQIVSKWVGETEKQLAKVFDAAEQGHGLLLFDEADALFGQRTQDVKGAVDRYANLEVNYLLQRVESFGGITILTTNLDQGIDRALKRRLAAHIVFDLPDDDERTLLWQRLTTTASAPLDNDIDVEWLAREFPKMSGANIRNAALAAAFLAAAAGASTIGHATLVRAARAEYRSMGHVLTDRRH